MEKGKSRSAREAKLEVVIADRTSSLMDESWTPFVAPEGVYSVVEEHKPAIITSATAALPVFPTKISTVIVRYPGQKPGPQPFAQLLGKEQKKIPQKDRDDGVSVSSSDTQDEFNSPDLAAQAPQDGSLSTPATPYDQLNNIFSSHSPGTPMGKKKGNVRPKHNIRTTSSTFLTRVQSAEGLTKSLQSKQGEATYLFYNHVKSFIWTEVGTKMKVSPSSSLRHMNLTRNRNLWPDYTSLHTPHATM